MGFVKNFLRNQDGVVESSLVMIPLLVLFLLTVEMIVTVNYRNLDQTFAQSDASSEAISQVISGSDDVISFSSPHSYDDLRLVVTHRTRLIPRLIAGIPFLAGIGDAFTDVKGVAVMEHHP